MRSRSFWLSLTTLITLVISLWSFRWTWITPFDSTYLQNLYDHSQWRLPLSPRIMGDQQLYQLASFKYATGSKLFTIVPEVPPLGLYMYGLSTQLFGSPYIATYILFALCLIVFWFLVRAITSSKENQHLAMALFTAQSVLITQLGQTMLDLPQLLGLLLHVLGVLQLQKSKTTSQTLVASIVMGVGLGIFASVKFPAFVIALVLADVLLFWRSKKILFVGCSWLVAAGLFTSIYTPYILENGVIAWIKSLKWTVSFYQNQSATRIPAVFIVTAFTSLYRGWWNDSWQSSVEWSPLWLACIFTITATIKSARSTIVDTFEKKVIVSFGGLLVLLLTVFPFWARYMLIASPFVVLASVVYWRWNKKLLIAILGFCLLWNVQIWLPLPTQTAHLVAEKWSARQFDDVRELVEPSQRPLTAEEFQKKLNTTYSNMQASNTMVSVSMPMVYPWQHIATGQLTHSFDTPLGPVTYQQPLHFKKVLNQWYVVWEWSTFLPNFTADSSVEMKLTPHKYGSLTTSDKIVITRINQSNQIVINKSLISQTQPLIEALHPIVDISTINLSTLLFVTYRGVEKAPIPLTVKPITSEELRTLQEFSGVEYQTVPAIELIPTLNTLPDYERLQALLEQNPTAVGQIGGSITISNPTGGNFTLLSRDDIPGTAVTLPDTGKMMFGDKKII